VNLSELPNYTDFGTLQPAAAPLKGETHSGADVGIFATGKWIHRTHQNDIQHNKKHNGDIPISQTAECIRFCIQPILTVCNFLELLLAYINIKLIAIVICTQQKQIKGAS